MVCTDTAGQVSHQKATILLLSSQEPLLHNYTEHLPVLLLCNFHQMRNITQIFIHILSYETAGAQKLFLYKQCQMLGEHTVLTGQNSYTQKED
jgi:hypothetical protein